MIKPIRRVLTEPSIEAIVPTTKVAIKHIIEHMIVAIIEPKVEPIIQPPYSTIEPQ